MHTHTKPIPNFRPDSKFQSLPTWKSFLPLMLYIYIAPAVGLNFSPKIATHNCQFLLRGGGFLNPLPPPYVRSGTPLIR